MSRKGDVLPRSRRLLHLGGHKPPASPVEAAVERVAEQDDSLLELTLPVAPDPVQLATNRALEITAPANPREAAVMVHDRSDGPWRAVLLPPGTTWQLHPLAKAKAAPSLWTPPGTARRPS